MTVGRWQETAMWKPIRRGLAAALSAAVLAAAPAAAIAGDEGDSSDGWDRARNAGRAAFDLVILRPLSLTQTVAGLGFFVFYPVTLVTGGSDQLVDYLWRDPVERTFERPLGDL